MNTKQQFLIEITDTYGGEANYSWVRRYRVVASSFKGAINKLSRAKGSGWRIVGNYGDSAQYNLQGACVTCFVMTMGDYERAHYSDVPSID